MLKCSRAQGLENITKRFSCITRRSAFDPSVDAKGLSETGRACDSSGADNDDTLGRHRRKARYYETNSILVDFLLDDILDDFLDDLADLDREADDRLESGFLDREAIVHLGPGLLDREADILMESRLLDAPD